MKSPLWHCLDSAAEVLHVEKVELGSLFLFFSEERIYLSALHLAAVGVYS